MSNPAVFEVRIKQGASYPVHAHDLTVGTSAACGIALRDPVASDVHCRFSIGPQGYQVEDLGSGTGTWVNGLPAEEPTRVINGDLIVVGVTRIRATGGGQPLELDVEEAEFHYTKSGAGGAQRDADDWVRSEVGFGKIPAIRAAGWLATAALLLFLVAMVIGVVPNSTLMPGALAAGHGELFSLDIEEGRAVHGDAWVAMAERARDEGCAICHVSFGEPTLSNCASCHDEKVSATMHPFHTEAGVFEKGSLQSDTCLLCHTEHQGVESVKRRSRLECSTCHAEEQLDIITQLTQNLEANAAASAQVRSEPLGVERAPIGYADFDHSRHLAVEGVDCGTCHTIGDFAAGVGDFANVAFETCMGCHDSTDRYARPELAPIAANIPQEFKFDLDWHGTDGGGCQKCHVDDATTGNFRIVESPEQELAFNMRFRPHEEFFAGADGQRCTECHRRGAPNVSEGTVEGTFYHGVHLRNLDPTGSDPAELSKQCETCHKGQMQSPSLLADRGASKYHTLLGNCVDCHTTATGPSIESVGARTGSGTIARRDFPHADHASLEGGCFRCHSFIEPDNPFAARPTTPDDIRDCSACHSGHQNLGGGGCLICHDTLDGLAPPEFHGEVAFRENRPIENKASDGKKAFSHVTDDHFNYVEQGRCNYCHTDVAAAKDVASIQFPFQGQAACNPCHAGGGSGFHFALQR